MQFSIWNKQSKLWPLLTECIESGTCLGNVFSLQLASSAMSLRKWFDDPFMVQGCTGRVVVWGLRSMWRQQHFLFFDFVCVCVLICLVFTSLGIRTNPKSEDTASIWFIVQKLKRVTPVLLNHSAVKHCDDASPNNNIASTFQKTT